MKTGKSFIVCLLLTLACGLLIGCQKDTQEINYATPIVFEEPIMEQVVCDLLEKIPGEPTADDLRGITGLSLHMAYNLHDIVFTMEDGSTTKIAVDLDEEGEVPRILSMEDLRYFSDLEVVDGYINASIVTQLEFARHLSKLQVIDLRGTTGGALIIRGAGLEGLTDCTDMRTLTLSVQNKSSLKPLANMKQLTTLTLYGGYVRDVDTLQQLTALEKVGYIYFDSKEGRMPNLSNLTSLESISVANCNEVNGLVGMPNLTDLYLWPSIEDMDLSPLRQLNSLEALMIRGDNASAVAEYNTGTIDLLKNSGVKVEIN